MTTWNGVGYNFVEASIDTEFSVFWRHWQFKRLIGHNLRAHAPYAAVHVEWYEDPKNLAANTVYYNNRQAGKVNTW